MSSLIVGRDGDITRLALNRPDKANALDAALIEELLEAVEACCRDGTRLLVFEGEGRNFSNGFDLSDLATASDGDLVHRLIRIEQLLQAVYHAPITTLALAHGRNFGAGADLMLACGTRICAPDASFRMPGLRFGLQLGTRRLAHRIGNDAARAVLAESRIVDAGEALAIRFAQEIAPRETWAEIIADKARKAAMLAPDAAARLLAATVVDTRAMDMADLAASVAMPGLKARIETYQRSLRA